MTPVDGWRPHLACSGVITPAVEATRAVLAAAHPGARVVTLAQVGRTAADPPVGPLGAAPATTVGATNTATSAITPASRRTLFDDPPIHTPACDSPRRRSCVVAAIPDQAITT